MSALPLSCSQKGFLELLESLQTSTPLKRFLLKFMQVVAFFSYAFCLVTLTRIDTLSTGFLLDLKIEGEVTEIYEKVFI